jgi:hypothetical protein
MILPVHSNSVDEYLSEIESVTKSTFLQELGSFYRENIVEIRLIYNNIKSEVPRYYLGSDISMIVSGFDMDISDIVNSSSEVLRLRKFRAKYINFIRKNVNKYLNSDKEYIDQLSSIYQKIYKVNKDEIKKNLNNRYYIMKSKSGYKGNFVFPEILEDLTRLLFFGFY